MPSPFTCPSCQRIVYNRRLAACEFCGKELPEGIRLTPAEIEARDQRHDEWLEDLKLQRAEPESHETASAAGTLTDAAIVAAIIGAN